MVNINAIKPNMPVVCLDDGQFATVDHLEGPHTIKLKRDRNGDHYYIPVRWVLSTEDGKVKLDRPGDEAMELWAKFPIS